MHQRISSGCERDTILLGIFLRWYRRAETGSRCSVKTQQPRLHLKQSPKRDRERTGPSLVVVTTRKGMLPRCTTMIWLALFFTSSSILPKSFNISTAESSRSRLYRNEISRHKVHLLAFSTSAKDYQYIWDTILLIFVDCSRNRISLLTL